MDLIYIIFNQSHECDGYDTPSNTIDFISTNRDEAFAYFEKYCTNLPESDKWSYSYQLYAYPNGYNKMTSDERFLIKEEYN